MVCYLCHWLSFLLSVYAPLSALLTSYVSDLILPTDFCHLCCLPFSPLHFLSFLLPAFLSTSLFLRSSCFIASANHCEHSLLVNGSTAILFWLLSLTFWESGLSYSCPPVTSQLATSLWCSVLTWVFNAADSGTGDQWSIARLLLWSRMKLSSCYRHYLPL